MPTVKVRLGKRSYDIAVERQSLGHLGQICKSLNLGARGTIITDSNVGPLFAASVERNLKKAGFAVEVITIPAGEKSKSLKVVQACYDQLAAFRLERKSFVVALGGGVVGDLAGFVAATYLRGVSFIQVPTTLLAQVDSSVGGKVGVNLKAGKNLVGAFYQPLHVLCDLSTLSKLPDREFKAGLAEVIKYGIIYDKVLFARLESELPKLLKRDLKILGEVIARCCEIKAEVVSQDETESGLRAILNFGHTIGHGLEAISKYGKYLHGEAISIGQVAAAHLSHKILDLPEKDVDRIRDLFVRAGLPVTARLSERQKEELSDAMRLDKKVSGGEIKFVLAREIGRVDWGVHVPQNLVRDAIDWLLSSQH
jgi:3-dehydroquinate synthase